MNLTNEEVRDIKEYITEVLSDTIDSYMIEDIGIKKIDIIGSRMNGTPRKDSDLDILVEYTAAIKESYVFNMLNSLELKYNGLTVDFFPVQLY